MRGAPGTAGAVPEGRGADLVRANGAAGGSAAELTIRAGEAVGEGEGSS